MRYHSVDSRCWVMFSIGRYWTGLDWVSGLFRWYLGFLELDEALLVGGGGGLGQGKWMGLSKLVEVKGGMGGGKGCGVGWRFLGKGGRKEEQIPDLQLSTQ